MSVCGQLFGSANRTIVLSRLRALLALFKLRVVALLLLAAVGGAFLGAGGWPGRNNLALLLVSGGLVSAGASAINQYAERDVDARMARTRQRPLVTGAVSRSTWIPVLGGLMVIGPVLVVLSGNPALSLFLFLGAFIYLGVYTWWLKPRTPLNIVVGGAAGSCTVLSGGAVVGEWADPGVLGLAALVFLWTPIHFWSLALACRDDYERVGVPMLPVRTTSRRAAFWCLLHGLGGTCISLVLAARPALGLLYLVTVAGAAGALLGLGVQLLRQPTEKWAWWVFHASNVYLALVVLSICLDTVIG